MKSTKKAKSNQTANKENQNTDPIGLFTCRTGFYLFVAGIVFGTILLILIMKFNVQNAWILILGIIAAGCLWKGFIKMIVWCPKKLLEKRKK